MFAYLNPSDSITAVLSAALTTTAPKYHVVYQSETGGFNDVVGSLSDTAATIIAAPAEKQRAVKSIDVINVDTVPCTVTIAKVVNGTSTTLHAITLAVGDSLHIDVTGVKTVNTAGNEPTSSSIGLLDNVLLNLGDDADIALVNRASTLNANTALSGVVVGTPVVQATPANSLIVSNITASGDIVLVTNTGGNTLEAIRVDSSAQQIFLGHGVFDTIQANGTGLIVGHTAQLTVAGVVPELQVLGTTTGVDGSMALVTASTTNSAQTQIIIGKVGAAALGSFTTVAQSENLGALTWVGDDGVDLATVAARIGVIVNAAGTVAASRVPSDIVFYTDPGGADDAVREGMRLGLGAAGGGGVLFVGDGTVSSHAAVTGPGIVISQGGNDNPCFVLKSSDVSTGLTSGTGLLDVAVDDYLSIGKFAAATGGALIQVVGENAAVTTNLRIESYGGQPHTTHTAAGRALVEIYATQHDGANALANATADSNVFAVVGRVGAADVTLMIVDEDGEIHSDGGAQAAYDAHDDVALIRAFDKPLPGAFESHWDSCLKASEQDLIDLKILGGPRDGSSERGLVCVTRLQRLHNGAIVQLFQDMMGIAAALPEEQRNKLPSRVKERLELVSQ